MPNKLDVIKVRVINCPRCGKNHREIEFTEMRKPVPVHDGEWIYYAYYGRCLNTLAPVLGRRDKIDYQLRHFL